MTVTVPNAAVGESWKSALRKLPSMSSTSERKNRFGMCDRHAETTCKMFDQTMTA